MSALYSFLFVVVVCLVFFSFVAAAFLANKDVYNIVPTARKRVKQRHSTHVATGLLCISFAMLLTSGCVYCVCS